MSDPRYVVMLCSLAASIVMLAGKLTAYYLTRSHAFFADAAESVVHGAATALAAFSLWYAARPADREHPYGHGRIAYFSAGFEGALVLGAATMVVYEGLRGLFAPTELRNVGAGLLLSGGLAAINLALGLALLIIGRRRHSVVLAANGEHVLSDVWTTAAALLGVFLASSTGVKWLDPAAALVLGVLIMVNGLRLIRKSFGALMDSADAGLVQRIVDGLKNAVSLGQIVAFHQLRCRQVNDAVWMEVHMLVPGGISIEEAHRRVTVVEEQLKADFGDQVLQITSHIEPRDHDAAHPRGAHEADDVLAPLER
jgi:cation diffusion facilitator family transporter